MLNSLTLSWPQLLSLNMQLLGECLITTGLQDLQFRFGQLPQLFLGSHPFSSPAPLQLHAAWGAGPLLLHTPGNKFHWLYGGSACSLFPRPSLSPSGQTLKLGKVWECTIVELDSYDFTVSETRVRYKGRAGDCLEMCAHYPLSGVHYIPQTNERETCTCNHHLWMTYALVWVIGCITIHKLLSRQWGNMVTCYCPLPLHVPHSAKCPASPYRPLIFHVRNHSFFSPVEWVREWCDGGGGKSVAIRGKHRRGTRMHEYLLLKLSWTHVSKLVQRKGHISGEKWRNLEIKQFYTTCSSVMWSKVVFGVSLLLHTVLRLM